MDFLEDFFVLFLELHLLMFLYLLFFLHHLILDYQKNLKIIQEDFGVEYTEDALQADHRTVQSCQFNR